jgi:hypothetical protein
MVFKLEMERDRAKERDMSLYLQLVMDRQYRVTVNLRFSWSIHGLRRACCLWGDRSSVFDDSANSGWSLNVRWVVQQKTRPIARTRFVNCVSSVVN